MGGKGGILYYISRNYPMPPFWKYDTCLHIVHPCDINAGGCDHVCSRVGDSAVCSCLNGLILGSDGKSCIEG